MSQRANERGNALLARTESANTAWLAMSVAKAKPRHFGRQRETALRSTIAALNVLCATQTVSAGEGGDLFALSPKKLFDAIVVSISNTREKLGDAPGAIFVFRMMVASLLATGLMLPAHGAERLQLVEQQIEAGLIYNFLRYTQWPDDPASRADSPTLVCLFGGDPFAGHLQPIASRTVNQRAIEIRSPGTIACALLFVNAAEMSRWPQLRSALTMKPMLTVSDEGFADSGGMIEFTRANNRIGVKINTSAVTAAHLQVEDRFLRLATPASAGNGR